MRKIHTAAAAAILMSAVAFSTGRAAEPPLAPPPDTSRVTAETQAPALPPGVTQKDLKDEKAIRSAFGAFEKAALKSDSLSDIAGCLVAQDKERVNLYKQPKADALNSTITKIKDQWKAKYNQDFDITRAERQKAFSGIVVLTGEIDIPDALAGQWPVAQPAALVGGPDDKAQPAASKTEIDRAKEKYFGGDVKLEKGREVAVAQVPAVLGLPAVRCSLIKEHLTGWTFDIPNDITGQQIHDNLLKHMTMIADHPEQWPANVDEAYGLVGHHALMALYNLDLPTTLNNSGDRRSDAK